VATPLEQEASVAVEGLHAVIVIRDVDDAAFVDCNATGDGPLDPKDELPTSVTDASPHGKELAVAVEFLDTVMITVNYIDIALPVRRERCRIRQSVVDLEDERDGT
jgi:hypothetical protein